MPFTFQHPALLALLLVAPLGAQTPATSDPAILTARMANTQLKIWIGKAADQMSETDYAFKPTPDVRSFGAVIAHVADQNYLFCSAAKGEAPPVRDIEKNVHGRSDILRSIAESNTYCDAVYDGLTESGSRVVVKFGGRPLPMIAVLLFRTHHNSLHYGNIVTYMRLRGKVPPSTAALLP